MPSQTITNPKEALRIFEELDSALRVAECTNYPSKIDCCDAAKRKLERSSIVLTQDERIALEVGLEEARLSGKPTKFSAGPWSDVHMRLIREAFPGDEEAQKLHRRENDKYVDSLAYGPLRAETVYGLLR